MNRGGDDINRRSLGQKQGEKFEVNPLKPTSVNQNSLPSPKNLQNAQNRSSGSSVRTALKTTVKY